MTLISTSGGAGLHLPRTRSYHCCRVQYSFSIHHAQNSQLTYGISMLS